MDDVMKLQKRIAELEDAIDLRTWVKETLDDIEHEAMSEPRVTRLLKRIDQLEAAAAAREVELAQMRHELCPGGGSGWQLEIQEGELNELFDRYNIPKIKDTQE